MIIDIDPVAFWLGPFAVRWYALAYLVGFLAGWRYCLYLSGLNADSKPGREDIDDFLSWAIVGVILGGRLGYIIFYQFAFYLEHPLEALKIWQGGMSFHGGALGVVIVMLIYARRRGFSPFRLADFVCTAVPIGLFFGRIANFVNGELYGRSTEVSWGVVFPRGGDILRHPSQLYEAVLEGAVLFIVLFALIHMKALRDRPGFLSGAFLAGYGICRFIVEFFREPDAHLGFIIDVFSMGQLLSLPMILAGAALMIFTVYQKND